MIENKITYNEIARHTLAACDYARTIDDTYSLTSLKDMLIIIQRISQLDLGDLLLYIDMTTDIVADSDSDGHYTTFDANDVANLRNKLGEQVTRNTPSIKDIIEIIGRYIDNSNEDSSIPKIRMTAYTIAGYTVNNTLIDVTKYYKQYPELEEIDTLVSGIINRNNQFEKDDHTDWQSVCMKIQKLRSAN